MTTVSASLVKTLRDRCGAGMMDCKKALIATEGDIEAAVDWLRKSGVVKAEKRAGRQASEGVIAVSLSPNAGVAVELNCETDFVARNEQFIAAAKSIAEISRGAGGDLEATLAAPMGDGSSVSQELLVLTSTIGEHIECRRSVEVRVNDGFVASYIHNAATENVGQIAVLVGIKTNMPENQEICALGRHLAMHIAAANPAAISVEGLDAEQVERERTVMRDQAIQSGKPESIVDKMIEGRMKKFYSETVLGHQAFVIDSDVSVNQAIERVAASTGATIEVCEMVRWQIGDQVADASP